MNPKELLEEEAPLFALEISNKIENKKLKLTTSGLSSYFSSYMVCLQTGAGYTIAFGHTWSECLDNKTLSDSRENQLGNEIPTNDILWLSKKTLYPNTPTNYSKQFSVITSFYSFKLGSVLKI